MWLKDVQVEDPSHLRRRALLQLLRQYRPRDERFLRFTGVQRLGELVHTGLYPGNADVGLIGAGVPPSAIPHKHACSCDKKH